MRTTSHMDAARFKALLDFTFSTNQAAAEYLHVHPRTLKRWRAEGCPNACAVKLVMIKARGYLPNTKVWDGYSITNYHGKLPLLNLPNGQEFSLRDLEAIAYWRDDYNRLKAKEKAAKSGFQLLKFDQA